VGIDRETLETETIDDGEHVEFARVRSHLGHVTLRHPGSPAVIADDGQAL
jgi:hypothetical protein